MATIPCSALVSYIQQLKWPPTGHFFIWADILRGRQETEIYTTGSICHWGYSGHYSSHSWVKLGKTIVLWTQIDPNNSAKHIFCMCYCWITVCVILQKQPGRTHTSKQQASSQNYHETEKDIATGFNPCSSPRSRDWWLHSGFPHTTNWIHRSLDTRVRLLQPKDGGRRGRERKKADCWKRGNTDEVV